VAGEHCGFAGIVFTGQPDEAASFGPWRREGKKSQKNKKNLARISDFAIFGAIFKKSGAEAVRKNC